VIVLLRMPADEEIGRVEEEEEEEAKGEGTLW
jgi:hypothetical protein